MTSTVRYVTDERGQRTAVILDIAEYEALLHAAEDAEDIRAAEAAEADDSVGLPMEHAFADIEAARAQRKAS